MDINKYIETEVVIYLDKSEDKDIEEVERLRDLGIFQPNISESEEVEEKIVKYSFWIGKLLEVRESLVHYKGDWLEGVVITTMEQGKVMTTPVILIPYKDLFNKLGLNEKREL